mmetsp:Transcript_19827/g.32156  ORF Transcript_19827/g.32156 Transcript_19827/m.32156 type:complete len:96 (-) Transcript_19827:1556-1843(-)
MDTQRSAAPYSSESSGIFAIILFALSFVFQHILRPAVTIHPLYLALLSVAFFLDPHGWLCPQLFLDADTGQAKRQACLLPTARRCGRCSQMEYRN